MMEYYFIIGILVAVVCIEQTDIDNLNLWDSAGVILSVALIAFLAWPAILLRFIFTRN